MTHQSQRAGGRKTKRLILESGLNDPLLPRLPTPLPATIVLDGRPSKPTSSVYNLRVLRSRQAGLQICLLDLPHEIMLMILELAYGHQDVYVRRMKSKDGNRYVCYDCGYAHSIEEVWRYSTEGADAQDPKLYKNAFLESSLSAGIHTSSHDLCAQTVWYGASPAINRELWTLSF
jgi:hypothetical protein